MPKAIIVEIPKELFLTVVAIMEAALQKLNFVF
jgi:hypothetical protein